MGQDTFPHLRDVLNAGELPTDERTANGLLEGVQAARCSQDPQRWAWVQRTYVIENPADERDRALSWAADLAESPELISAVYEVLGDKWTAEAELLVDMTLRPFPLTVGPRIESERAGTHWDCNSCGSSHENDEMALVITGRPDWSELEDPITYCGPCISMAAAAFGEVEAL